MKRYFKPSKKQRGFTLIESLVLLFIFSVVSIVFLQVYIVGSQMIVDSKNRLGAVALANQKMEIIRSIEYEAIGTKTWNGSAWVYGIPGGDILQEEDVAINTREYHVSTFVQYVDDPFDGTTSSNPRDTIPTDYKRVRVQVSWGGKESERVTLFGNFTPNGLETAVAGGTLSINVLHADGSGVVGASVNLQNQSGTINVNASTDATGNVTLPGTPAGTQSYTVTVSKSGYYGANTYPPYPTTSYNPVDVHATVVANTLNQISIVMDESVDIPIQTVDPYDQAIPAVSFSFSGGRVLGTNPTTGASVVTVNDASRTTNGSGEYTYNDQSYGVYTLKLTSASQNQYDFYKILPESSLGKDKVDSTPGSSQVYKVVLLDKARASVKVIVQDSTSLTPLAGATVRLQKTDTTYDATATTDQFGLAFFPNTTTPLVAGDYTLTAELSGYQDDSANLTVGTELVSENLTLTAD